MFKGDYSKLRSLHLELEYYQWCGETLAEDIKNMHCLEELYLVGINESMELWNYAQTYHNYGDSGWRDCGLAQVWIPIAGELSHTSGLAAGHPTPHLPTSFGLDGFLKYLPEVLQSTPRLVELGIYISTRRDQFNFLKGFWDRNCAESIFLSLKHASHLVALLLPDPQKDTVHLSATIMHSSRNWPPQVRFIGCDKGPYLDCKNELHPNLIGDTGLIVVGTSTCTALASGPDPVACLYKVVTFLLGPAFGDGELYYQKQNCRGLSVWCMHSAAGGSEQNGQFYFNMARMDCELGSTPLETDGHVEANGIRSCWNYRHNLGVNNEVVGRFALQAPEDILEGPINPDIDIWALGLHRTHFVFIFKLKTWMTELKGETFKPDLLGKSKNIEGGTRDECEILEPVQAKPASNSRSMDPVFDITGILV
ncbi:hypothetical protein BS47DRAFT_1366105 [Hydnum rufescens UP504]|uniref:Uncharacterized protein n=1 Tax=Hydnum rufescens UP504 TaxID=1448309 RepID=A0A9P6ALS6_9AGAM|nr:hypothetical protein BS47DRAFT_1366105 [Hydnum rufescens UP504]